MSDYIREAFDGDDIPKKNIALRKAYDEIERLNAENARLREALDKIAALDVPRPVWKRFRTDEQTSKYDICPHEISMWGDCPYCISDYAHAALAGKEEK